MGKKWIGTLLVIFGIGFLLQETNLLDFGELLSNWWPLVIILIGIMQLFFRSNSSSITGMLFIVVGGILLIGQFIHYNVWAFIWPLILIVIGVSFLFSRASGDKFPHNEQYIRVMSLFSGSNVRSQSVAFKGGTITSIFGGAKVDLRDAIIKDGAVIDVASVFGGLTLYVPIGTHVEISGLPIFGGWDDKTVSNTSLEKDFTLRLKCHTIFGGVDVRN